MLFSRSMILSLAFALVGIAHSNTTSNTSCQSNTRYPNQCQIAKIFNNLGEGNFTAFFEHVADDVHWTFMGHSPLSGQYYNRTTFIVSTIERLANTLDPAHPSKLVLTNVIGGGDDEWSVQELHGTGVCKNGLVYDNRFAWVTRWNTEGTIVQTNSYLDTALIYMAITENESGEYNYNDVRTKVRSGPSGSNCKH